MTSPLTAYGRLDSCRAVVRAYELYKYHLNKEEYEKNARDHRPL